MKTPSTKISESIPNRIYIVGFMGVGKSTLGKKLAAKLNYAFYDTDNLIEQKTGKSITDIFNDGGEAYFRNVEHEILKETLDLDHAIIATGGGLPYYYNNMQLINQHGLSVYLRADKGFILQRIKYNQGKRPLVSGMNEEQLKSFIQYKLSEREPYYTQARHSFDIPLTSFETLIKSIL